MPSMRSDGGKSRLADIRHNIVLAHSFIGTMTFEQFAADTMIFYATTRALEIISEASRFLPDDLKARHAGVDWVSVRDAGNVYRHAYDIVTEKRVWDTVTKALGPLERAVLHELGEG